MLRCVRVVTIRAFSAARWICLTFLVIQLPVTEQYVWTGPTNRSVASWSLSSTVPRPRSLSRKISFSNVPWCYKIDELAITRPRGMKRSYRGIGQRWIVVVSMNRWGRIDWKCIQTLVHEWEAENVPFVERRGSLEELGATERVKLWVDIARCMVSIYSQILCNFLGCEKFVNNQLQNNSFVEQYICRTVTVRVL